MNFSDIKVRQSLMKKGFKNEPNDHQFFVLYVDGKRTKIKTKTSHCGQDIDDYLISKMKKQVHLSKSEFADLINCPLSYENYVRLLKERNEIKT